MKIKNILIKTLPLLTLFAVSFGQPQKGTSAKEKGDIRNGNEEI